jgi:hypothetical protein
MENHFEAEGIRGILHQPENPTGEALALTHGAGANCQAPLLASLARAFAAAGLVVLRYDLPFRQLRLKGPPMPAGAARDRDGVELAVKALQAMVSGPIFAGGHSYGGRQTAMAAAERPGMATALLLLSYPLHPPAKPAQLRTASFPELRTPALFVHGAADPFATPAELADAVKLIPARSELFPIPASGHELKHAPARANEFLEKLRTLAHPAA